ILHNRIWLKKNDQQLSVPLPYDRQLHMPNIRQMLLQMWQNIQMFIVQALPIFITICLIVSILSLTPILNVLSQIFTPILSLLGISSELSPGILFSMIRKDGMLLFNLHQGALLQGMTATQLLLLVFFSSTFTACSVTMTMLLKHLGGQSALKLIGKQMVTSLSLVIGVGIIVKIVMLII
ncbi:ferrous iron transporter B, partial [Staphylococcus aureus]|nr:ferrous iron transporter B [Staphylococcus aureus]